MKEYTAEELLNLKYGQKVYRLIDTEIRKLYFVAPVPHSPRTLIFVDGSFHTHVYVDKNNTFTGRFFDGTIYDSKFIGNLIIEAYQKNIEVVKEVYLDGK